MIGRLGSRVFELVWDWVSVSRARMIGSGALVLVLLAVFAFARLAPTSRDAVCGSTEDLRSELTSSGTGFDNGVFDAAGSLGSKAERLRDDSEGSDAVRAAGERLSELAAEDSASSVAFEGPLAAITSWCAAGAVAAGSTSESGSSGPVAIEPGQPGVPMRTQELTEQQEAERASVEKSRAEQDATFMRACEGFAEALTERTGLPASAGHTYQAETTLLPGQTSADSSRDCDLTVAQDQSRLRVFVLTEQGLAHEAGEAGLATFEAASGLSRAERVASGSVNGAYVQYAASRDVGDGQTQLLTVALPTAGAAEKTQVWAALDALIGILDDQLAEIAAQDIANDPDTSGAPLEEPRVGDGFVGAEAFPTVCEAFVEALRRATGDGASVTAMRDEPVVTEAALSVLACDLDVAGSSAVFRSTVRRPDQLLDAFATGGYTNEGRGAVLRNAGATEAGMWRDVNEMDSQWVTLEIADVDIASPDLAAAFQAAFDETDRQLAER